MDIKYKIIVTNDPEIQEFEFGILDEFTAKATELEAQKKAKEEAAQPVA